MMRMNRLHRTGGSLTLLAALALLARPACAEDAEIVLRIKDHQFVPSEISAPAHQRVKIVVKNEDGAPAEFESVDFHREKVVQPGREISVFVGPLDAGSFEFFDEFHPGARGHLIIK